MIRVHRGHGGWLINRTSMTFALVAAIAIAGCSSKSKQTLTPEGNPSGLGEENKSGSSLEQWKNGTFGQNAGPLSDIHFAYNEYTIEPQDGEVLRSNAGWLSKNPNTRVQVEGHCDERGSEEYNIALGAKRAQAAKEYLTTLGVPPSRISTISYGKELPLCPDHQESCWSQNRRDHFAVSQ